MSLYYMVTLVNYTVTLLWAKVPFDHLLYKSVLHGDSGVSKNTL